MIGFGLANAFVEFSSRGGSRVEQQVQRVTAGVRSLLALAGGGVGLAGSFSAASELEQLEIALNTLTGDSVKATSALEKLREMSRTITFTELAGAAQKLVALGFEADQAVELTKNLQDILTATGRAGDQGAINSVILALTQIRNVGAVTAEEMRQLKNQNLDAQGVLAHVLGKSQSVIKKMVEARQIGAEVLINAILRMEGPLERMAGFADQAGDSLLGVWVQTKNAVFESAAELGGILADFLGVRRSIEFVRGGMDAFVGLVRTAADVAMAANEFFGGWPARILAAAAGLVVVVGLTQALLSLASALLFNPFTLMIVGAAALVAILLEVTGVFEQVRNAGIASATGVSDAWSTLFELWDAQLQAFSASLFVWFDTQATRIENFWKEIWNSAGARIPLSSPDAQFDDAARNRLEEAQRRWDELKASIGQGVDGTPFNNFLEKLNEAGDFKIKFQSGSIEDLNKTMQKRLTDNTARKQAQHIAAMQKDIGNIAAAGAGRGLNVLVKNPANSSARFA